MKLAIPCVLLIYLEAALCFHAPLREHLAQLAVPGDVFSFIFLSLSTVWAFYVAQCAILSDANAELRRQLDEAQDKQTQESKP